jgi:hypothetical protein
MGTPHYCDSVARLFQRRGLCDRAKSLVHNRIRTILGVPGLQLNEQDLGEYGVTTEVNRYGIGNVRSREDFLKFAEIDLEARTCGDLTWCLEGEVE